MKQLRVRAKCGNFLLHDFLTIRKHSDGVTVTSLVHNVKRLFFDASYKAGKATRMLHMLS